MKLLLRWVFTAVAIFAAVKLLPGLAFRGEWWQLGIVALIFGLLNALVRPVIKFLTCPLIVLTLGLFTLVINAAMLWLTAVFAESFGINFRITDFWSAFVGALVITIVSAVLNLFVSDDED
ncbi:MAG TPA: phage holin family protein [Blastocatellia bacterium]|nr:phage holin family protein [Blastocatellia bacterium]